MMSPRSLRSMASYSSPHTDLAAFLRRMYSRCAPFGVVRSRSPKWTTTASVSISSARAAAGARKVATAAAKAAPATSIVCRFMTGLLEGPRPSIEVIGRRNGDGEVPASVRVVRGIEPELGQRRIARAARRTDVIRVDAEAHAEIAARVVFEARLVRLAEHRARPGEAHVRQVERRIGHRDRRAHGIEMRRADRRAGIRAPLRARREEVARTEIERQVVGILEARVDR